MTPETIKILWSTKSKTAKDENGKSESHLKITEVDHRNIFNNDNEHDSVVLYTFELLIFHLKALKC